MQEFLSGLGRNLYAQEPIEHMRHGRRLPTNAERLTKCNTTADLFANTCAPRALVASFASHAGATMNCTGTARCPGGTGTAASCTFVRKLSVSCIEKSGDVYIRFQTNGMPNHCFAP